MHKESHQYIDVVSMMRPITKWNARLNSAADHPRGRAQGVQGRRRRRSPAPTHIELPEDVMAAQVDAEPLPARTRRAAGPSRARDELLARPPSHPRRDQPGRAGRQRRRPRRRRRRRCASSRARPASASRRRSWARALLDYEDPHCARHRRPPVARLRARRLRGRRRGDHGRLRPRRARARATGTPSGDKKIVCIDTVAPEVDEHFITEVDLIGDIYHILSRLAEELARRPARAARLAAARHRARPLRGRQGRRRVPDAAAARAVGDPPGAAAARTSSSPTSACTSCGSRACSRRTSPTRCSSPTAWPAWASRCRPRSPPSSCIPTATSSRSTATAAS